MTPIEQAKALFAVQSRLATWAAILEHVSTALRDGAMRLRDIRLAYESAEDTRLRDCLRGDARVRRYVGGVCAMLSVARRIGAAATQSEFMTPGAAISHAVEEVPGVPGGALPPRVVPSARQLR